MPQMNPMFWLFLMFFFILGLAISWIKIYYN